MRLRGWAAALTFGLAWVVNPAFVAGCQRAPSFDFGAAQTVPLLDAANHAGPYRLHTLDADLTVSFELTQSRATTRSSINAPPFVRSAHACGQRTFVRSAGACLDTTDVPVEGNLTVSGASGATLVDRVPATGDFTIEGTPLKGARVRLQIDAEADSVYLTGDVGEPLSVRFVKIGSDGFSPGMARILVPKR